MKEFINQLKPFEFDRYEGISIDQLIMYTSVELEKLAVPLSLENITVAAFILFPKKFSLSGYPEYPDAIRVEKALWRSKGKNKRWIGGKTPHGYLLTNKTRGIAAQISNQLLIESSPKKHRKPSKLPRKERILRDAMSSSAYIKFSEGKLEEISNSDFCYLLQGTLDSSKDTLRSNLDSMTIFAQELGKEDFLEFIYWAKENFSDFLNV